MLNQLIDERWIDQRGRRINEQHRLCRNLLRKLQHPRSVKSPIELAGLQGAAAPAIGPAARGSDAVEYGHGTSRALGEDVRLLLLRHGLDLGKLIFPAENRDGV